MSFNLASTANVANSAAAQHPSGAARFNGYAAILFVNYYIGLFLHDSTTIQAG